MNKHSFGTRVDYTAGTYTIPNDGYVIAENETGTHGLLNDSMYIYPTNRLFVRKGMKLTVTSGYIIYYFPLT